MTILYMGAEFARKNKPRLAGRAKNRRILV